MDQLNTRLLFIILLFQFGFSNAQPQQIAPKEGKIKGFVIDGNDQSPLEFATISVLTSTDSLVVTGGVTDETGLFEISAPFGNYLVKVEFISYAPQFFEGITLSESFPVATLEKISLSSDAQMLNEVEVRAEKSQLQMSFDKKVFNVGKDLANTSGNAAQILDNIPSVTVDVEGVVTLRGSDGVRILVDGKPSGLVGLRGANGLRSIPANLIEKVEIITNPSARYEAEGMSGIINIVLKKDRKKGLNGSFDVSGGYPLNYGGAINLNYRRKKLNFFTNVGANYRENPGIRNLYQEFYNDAGITIVDQDGDRERKEFSQSFRFGADYFFDDKNVLTTSFLYRESQGDNTSSIIYNNYLDELAFENLTSVRVREEIQDEDEPTLEYALNYRRTYDQKGKELKATLQYQDSKETAFSDFVESISDSEMVPLAEDLLQRASNDERESSILGQIDFVQPIGEDGQFEIGYRGSFRRIDNDYFVEEFENQAWMRDAGLSNDFNYEEDIHAAYASISNKIGQKFSYQFGLRAEHSIVLTELLQTGEVNDRDYTNLFPSAFFGYEFGGQNSLQVSYSRRLRRPRFWDLNPFFTFSDSRNIFRGNPNLDPEFTNSFELGHIKYWDKTSITSSIYYRHTTGEISRVTSLVEQGGELITVRQPENLAEEKSFGLEFIVSSDPLDWLRINGDINFFRSITDGSNINESFSAETFSLSGRLNTRITIQKSIDVQISGGYRAPRNTSQGKRRSSGSIDLGVSKDILKNKGTLTLSVRDLLNTRLYRYDTFGDDFFSSGVHQWRSRQSTLTFNYRLNQQKRRGGRGNRRGNYGGGDEF